MTDFYLSDVGRDIVAAGGLGTITGYTSATAVTVEVKQAFPAVSFNAEDWVILGTPQTTCTPSARDPIAAPITLTLAAAGWRPADVGKHVRLNGGLARITSRTSSTIAQAVIVVTMSSAVAAESLAWTLEAPVWGPRYGWPRCGTLHEQRLWLAGSRGFPHSLWGSVIGEALDHTLGSEDDDAMALIVASGELNPIRHLATVRGMVALTSSGEFSIRGGQDRAITPTNFSVRSQSDYGASTVRPATVGTELFLTQRAGRKIRALSLNQYDSDQYIAPDMAVLAEHVTKSGIADMAYQAEPDAVLYAVRHDGQMATLTADRDQDVFAWARQLTQGNFESVEVVPVADGDTAFVVVARTVGGVTTRFIEKFDAGLNTDCALTGSSVGGAATWSGLGHLEGRTIRVKGDGIVMADRVVTAGAVTLERAAFKVEFGLDYITAIKTLTPEVAGAIGSTQGANVRISEVKVRLLETIGCTINLQAVPFRKYGINVLDAAPAPFTGDKIAGNMGWGDGVAQVLIQQTQPYPFHLLSVIVKLTANDP